MLVKMVDRLNGDLPGKGWPLVCGVFVTFQYGALGQVYGTYLSIYLFIIPNPLPSIVGMFACAWCASKKD